MADENTTNYFTELNAVDVSGKVEKKGKFDYLSWVHAWSELKRRHPDANYTVYENDRGWNYHTDNVTAWVKVGVTVCGIEHIEHYPITDNKHDSLPLEEITSFDVNTAIKRALTKAIALHGIGLHVFEGEDLPEAERENRKALDRAKQALTNFCYSYDPTGNTAAAVWQKYDVDAITDPDKVNEILYTYRAKAKAAEEKAKADSMPEEV